VKEDRVNRLKFETSPYLLQHKDNPVHWWPWGPEALAEAKRTGKPILLSVGYAACHWCHVMAHESFEDEATASVMNELFVNIKVDREERPDIDAIYMGALHRLGEQGGWPLTMFLDSDARPFWGGTYFPKEARFGRSAFITVLLRIAEAFESQPDNVRSNAEAILASLAPQANAATVTPLPEATIKELVSRIARAVDPVHGGLQGAPKFPQWNVFWLLWRGAMKFADATARQAVVTTLNNICQGGIYDHLGGGFARYSVDEFWLVPHFEKMLYDNALLIDLLTEAWRETQSPLYAARVAETVEWLLREMLAEDGGFASSLDADSEGEEGKFYVWKESEIVDALGVEDARLFAEVYGVTEAGNFEGHTILNRLDSQNARGADDEERLANLRAKLLEHRSQRVRPGFDDKILADWNGLMIAALSRAAVVFEKPEWLALAQRAFASVTRNLSAGGGRLFHAYRAGQAKAPATASDYANMTWAALRLFQATLETNYLDRAKAWSRVLQDHYWDADGGGYFTSADDTSDVVVRLKSASDDAVPSANTIQFSNLLALAVLTGEDGYEQTADRVLTAFAADVLRGPVGHCGLVAASLDADALIQIVTVGTTANGLAYAVNQVSAPGAVQFQLPVTEGTELPPALSEKIGLSGGSKAYVCRGKTCLPPVDNYSSLRPLIIEARQ